MAMVANSLEETIIGAQETKDPEETYNAQEIVKETKGAMTDAQETKDLEETRNARETKGPEETGNARETKGAMIGAQEIFKETKDQCSAQETRDPEETCSARETKGAMIGAQEIFKETKDQCSAQETRDPEETCSAQKTKGQRNFQDSKDPEDPQISRETMTDARLLATSTSAGLELMKFLVLGKVSVTKTNCQVLGYPIYLTFQDQMGSTAAPSASYKPPPPSLPALPTTPSSWWAWSIW